MEETDYPHHTMCELKFPALVIEYLKHHTARELADHCECAVATVTRWANGFVKPMPGVMQWVTNHINELRKQENW